MVGNESPGTGRKEVPSLNKASKALDTKKEGDDISMDAAAVKPPGMLAKARPSASFRLRNGSLNAVRLRRVFDRNGDGEITVEELAQALDADRAGLRFQDFDALHRALDDDDEEMREAFRVFDVDGDGFISAAELQTVLKKLGLPEASSMANVKEMICNVGRVDFGEFKCMMKGITVWGA